MKKTNSVQYRPPSEKNIQKNTGVRKVSLPKINKVPTMKPISQKSITATSKPNKLYERQAKNNYKKSRKGDGWESIPSYILSLVSSFVFTTPVQLVKLSQVCSIWRNHIHYAQDQRFWNYIRKYEGIQNFSDFKTFMKNDIILMQEKMAVQYEKKFTTLFNYGSTKQNVPNKLIQRLQLELEIKINNQGPKKYKYNLRSFNFGSYLFVKVNDVSNFKYDFYSERNMFKNDLKVQLKWKSLKYRVEHKICKKYIPQQVVQKAIKQKAFNYFLDKNLILTYFEGDDHFLYLFYEISALQIVNTFRQIIKKKHQELLHKQKKKTPLFKQLAETEFSDLEEYIRFQADFQLHISYHNSVKQIFTYANTKVYPVQFDKKYAYFDINIKEPFDGLSTFKLDNKMGMSENVENLYLLDLILKDRDRFVVIYSGFTYAKSAKKEDRQSLEDYFALEDKEIKILEIEQKKYHIKIVVVDEGHRKLMNKVIFKIYSL